MPADRIRNAILICLPLANLLFSACFKPSQEGFFNAILMPPFLFLTLF